MFGKLLTMLSMLISKFVYFSLKYGFELILKKLNKNIFKEREEDMANHENAVAKQVKRVCIKYTSSTFFVLG